MEYIIIIIGAFLALVVWGIWNERNQARLLRLQLKEQWGEIPDEDYSSEKLEALKFLFNSEKDGSKDIDNITWNDVDMDEIYMLMNNTQCAAGEEFLYYLLRKPCYSKAELEERNRLMELFEKDEDMRLKLQLRLHRMGKLRNISCFDYINRLDELNNQSNLPHYLMALGLLVSFITIFIIPPIGGVASLLFAIINTFQYFRKKAVIENYLTVISFIIRILDGVKLIADSKISGIDSYLESLRKDTAMFQSFKRGASMLVRRNVSGDILDMVLDYVRILFHLDIIKFNSMLAFLKKNKATLIRIMKNVGYLDSMIAAASFRNTLDYYCIPELTLSDKPMLQVTGLYHPLVEGAVPNSMSAKRSVLITGSNASGKSTFIKSLAVNAILSQTIDTSVSRSYKASYFMIYSSMALRDNILAKESYYIVEIKSLKRILDRVNSKLPVLCFIDEVLRGTNTLERIAASSRILGFLSESNAMVIAATHDIELTNILEKHYENYHFQEKILDNSIEFDYMLYPGRAVSRNAILLLNLLGYPKDIINDSEQAANDFLTKGEWARL